MVNWKKYPTTFQLYLYSMFFIVVLLIGSFIVVAHEQARYQQAVKSRETSIRLAEELRQSSSDLARLVRTYVITGKPEYKEQFQAVVEIRDGKRPRPHNYSLAYWDFKAIEAAAEIDETKPQEIAVPLVELMRQAGVTKAELENLKKSKARSDELVDLENRAMALIEEQTPTSAQKRDQALAMLADNHFMAMKAEIMRPIIETEQMIIARTQYEVTMANQRLQLATAALFVLGAFLILLIFKVGQELRRIIGCSIQDLQQTITVIGSGDFLTPIQVDKKYSDSVLAWIAQTQRKLAELNLAHFKAIVDSSDDAIISKNINGIVASCNQSAEVIFGYTADEMIGQSLKNIIPPDRLHEEPGILASISRGEKVNHFETQRMHRDGHLVDVSVTISPIYNAEGQVIGASKIARDISMAKAAEAEIHRLAFYDSLTGLANRSLLNDRLSQAIIKSCRDSRVFALLFLDLDNFKILNDTKGHDAGDELLKEAALRLKEVVRDSDTVARFGGDEFVVLLNGPAECSADPDTWVCNVINKVIQRLAEPYHVAGIVHCCTASVGATLFRGQQYTASDLLKQADHAMYEAKHSGKNCFKIFDMNDGVV